MLNVIKEKAQVHNISRAATRSARPGVDDTRSGAPRFSAGQQDTLIDALSRAVARAGDKPFLTQADETVTFAQFDTCVTRFANALLALGIGAGDVVVSMLDNSLDAITIWFGINRIGAIWAPINTAYRHEFLRHQIADTGAHLIICDAVYLDRIVEIADSLPDVRLILERGDGPYPDCAVPIAPFGRYRGKDETPIDTEIKPADLAALIYTSGTTGPSKGCMISHNNLCVWGRQHRAIMRDVDPDDIGWTSLPLFHTAAITFLAGQLIGCMTLAIAARFSVSNFWDDLESCGANNVVLVASMIPMLAHAPETPAMKRYHGRLTNVIAVPLMPEMRDLWRQRFGVTFISGAFYGTTEANRISMSTPNDPVSPDFSVGRIADEYEVLIVDGNDHPQPDGSVGEIICRPRHPHIMFEGYWRRPEDTAQAWRNLWMHTGDLGKIEGGYLFFVDRQKDYLRFHGENISSFEVERTFAAHPAIKEVAVHAVGIQSGEDRIKLTVVLVEGAALDAAALCQWSIDHLPHFAVPHYYEFRLELPKNPTGRVLKYQLRDEGVTATTWDREAHGIIVRRR